MAQTRRVRKQNERAYPPISAQVFALPRHLTAYVIPVVMSYPVSQVMIRTRFIAPLWQTIQVTVRPAQHFASARVDRIGMIHVIGFALEEHAGAVHFLGLNIAEVVVEKSFALRQFFLSKRHMIVVVEIIAVR